MSELKQKILSLVSDDLSKIEDALEKNLNPYLDLVSQTAKHILFAGGKRLRPLLMVLSARACNYEGDFDKDFSAIFEYLHAATLLHDDLVDDAVMRRGRKAAHLEFNNPTAVLVGDFLLARSLSLAAETRNPDVIKIIAKITEDMSQGEIHQLMNKGNLDLTEKEYMSVIEKKTAVLIQGACRTGALISDESEEKEKALSDYGYNLGIAFQMADDLLDYTTDSEALGKEVGADLREGKLTLPVIYSLEKADEPDQESMKQIICREDFSNDDFQSLINFMDKYGGVSYTKKMAEHHVGKAKKSLQDFNDSQAKETLLMLADYALERKA